MRDRDHAFPEFLEAVRQRLPDRAEEPRFGFVVYRIWREYRFDLPAGWENWIRERFEFFEDEFDWECDARPSWIRQDLLERTLTVWQRRYPRRMRVKHAIEILANVRSLSESVGGSQ
ncbi:MAG: hypothetical protein GY733_03345 [bacterium]|nr:hypothetical protein [bacterium]